MGTRATAEGIFRAEGRAGVGEARFPPTDITGDSEALRLRPRVDDRASPQDIGIEVQGGDSYRPSRSGLPGLETSEAEL